MPAVSQSVRHNNNSIIIIIIILTLSHKSRMCMQTECKNAMQKQERDRGRVKERWIAATTTATCNVSACLKDMKNMWIVIQFMLIASQKKKTSYENAITKKICITEIELPLPTLLPPTAPAFPSAHWGLHLAVCCAVSLHFNLEKFVAHFFPPSKCACAVEMQSLSLTLLLSITIPLHLYLFFSHSHTFSLYLSLRTLIN